MPPTSPPGPDGRPPRANLLAVVRLLAALAAIIAVFLVAKLGALLVVIGAIVVIVALHEFAHFITAKWSRMKVTEFFIGFGPRLWSVRKGETEYGIKPIPAGAYVKIPGMTMMEEVDEADEPRTYRRQPFRKRILVASAGSLMHLLIAFVLAYSAVLAFGIANPAGASVAGFVKWSGHSQTAAQAAGLRKGDRILAVDGHQVDSSTELDKQIKASKGATLTFTVERAHTQVTVRVTPVRGHKVTTKEVLGSGSTWLIGIEITPLYHYTSEGPFRALGTAGAIVGEVGTAEITGLGHFFSPGGLHQYYSEVTNPSSKKASSPTSGRIVSIVGVARMAVQAEHHGAETLITILIALNLVLGLVNMLPLLPLDGGHVAVALYERIRTRRHRPYYVADVKKLLPVTYVFVAVLIVLSASALYLDLTHPIASR